MIQNKDEDEYEHTTNNNDSNSMVTKSFLQSMLVKTENRIIREMREAFTRFLGHPASIYSRETRTRHSGYDSPVLSDESGEERIKEENEEGKYLRTLPFLHCT